MPWMVSSVVKSRIRTEKRRPGRARGAADWQLKNRAWTSSTGEVGRRATGVLRAAMATTTPEQNANHICTPCKLKREDFE
jgi:hypothetical protein